MEKQYLPANGLLFTPDEGGAPDSYEGYLRCPCGCEQFRVRHNGVMTSRWQRLWAANLFRPADGQPLVIEAVCTGCGQPMTLHCTERDEQGWLAPAAPQMAELILPRLHHQHVRLYVWYCWDEEAERVNGQYLISYSLFSLCAYSDALPKALHIYEKTC